MRRWKASTIARSGSMTITAAALIEPTGTSHELRPWK